MVSTTVQIVATIAFVFILAVAALVAFRKGWPLLTRFALLASGLIAIWVAFGGITRIQSDLGVIGLVVYGLAVLGLMVLHETKTNGRMSVPKG